MAAVPKPERGPFNVDQLAPGDRYELSDGHPIHCPPATGDHARAVGGAAELIDSDPAVESVGLDPGFALSHNSLRAPDIAVGVPDKPGWIQGAPPLAVEYAGTGQDEEELQEKIRQFLAAGTRFLWVVRLVGPRRVEIHEPGKPMSLSGPGDLLRAPGVLKNAVPVEAMFDREAAHEHTLRNLLQRRGFDGLEGALERGRAEGQAEGQARGKRDALLKVLARSGIVLSAEQHARLESCADLPTLDRWFDRALGATSADDVLG